MKFLTIISLTLAFTGIYGQEVMPEFGGPNWEAPYSLRVPKDWTIERFPIPISFAPQISYKGLEDIRFSPGWSKTESEEYWTYAFLWYLEGKVKINADTIGNDLKNYYSGLTGGNSSNIPTEKLIPVETSFKEADRYHEDLKTYTGTIKMLDYMGQKPIVLHCKVHLGFCQIENRTFLFFELSPQPFTHKVWKDLDKLWFDFKCIKTEDPK